jgi:hypothetical protein
MDVPIQQGTKVEMRNSTFESRDRISTFVIGSIAGPGDSRENLQTKPKKSKNMVVKRTEKVERSRVRIIEFHTHSPKQGNIGDRITSPRMSQLCAIRTRLFTWVINHSHTMIESTDNKLLFST